MNGGGNRGGFHRGNRNSNSSFGYQEEINNNRHDQKQVSSQNSTDFEHDEYFCANESSFREQTSSDSRRSNRGKATGSALIGRSSSRGRHQNHVATHNSTNYQRAGRPSCINKNPLQEQTLSESTSSNSWKVKGSASTGQSSSRVIHHSMQKPKKVWMIVSSPSSANQPDPQHHDSPSNRGPHGLEEPSAEMGVNSQHFQCSGATEQSFNRGRQQHKHESTERDKPLSTPEGAVSNSSDKECTDIERSSEIGTSHHWRVKGEKVENPSNNSSNQTKETLPHSSLDNKYQTAQTDVPSQQQIRSDSLVRQGSLEDHKICPSESSAVLPFSTDKKEVISKTIEHKHVQTSQEGGSTETSIGKQSGSFDICQINKTSGKLKPPIFANNRAIRKEKSRLQNGSEDCVLRPGMVLLKNYLSHMDQLKIIKVCRDLGMDVGGFYRPFVTEKAKMNLNMMCLGKNWNPKTKEYEHKRSIDGAVPPLIPQEFKELVKSAILSSHAVIKQQLKGTNPEEMVPFIEPDICIVNFYTDRGKLGLHQDKDESKESLRKGLPVVSFSIGDSAEFLYGDEMDIFKAEKIVLESGDVLIFGGKARHIFHGVPSIIRNTAPKLLVEESSLRPGRLNLTFRQY